MRKALYYLSWTVLLGFIFIMGVGSAKSLWGGIVALALVGSAYGIIALGPEE